MGILLKSFIFLFAVLQGYPVLGIFSSCNLLRCNSPAVRDQLQAMNWVPTTEEHLQTLCPPVLRSLRCLGEEVKICINMDVNQLATSENKTLNIIGNLFLNVGQFATEICSNETDLRRNYLASVSCFKDLYEDPEPQMKCHRDGDAIYSLYARSLDLLGEVQNEVREGEISERFCMVSAYVLACFTANLQDRCGNVARATFVDILRRFHYLKWKECPDIDLINLKTKFLNFLELEEGKKDIYSEVFNSQRRRK
ncbi:uncharacterized protein TNCT_281511 [Trichonephila clavata]|uniref:Uncharacterized protein n=1 Tax=Trichonephila clavata TaxID=2740835 RepID=A0A8X6FZX7_TRICU|nr:uncharacterized protein TNCT_281511 [Trichonephila clavata]